MSAAIALGVAQGRAEDDRTRIALGILTMLEGLTQRQGRYLEALDHYRGELSGNDLEQVMLRLKGRSPGVLVTVGSSQPESKSSGKLRYLYRYQIELAVISGHMESAEAREFGGSDRFDANADPGIGQMLHDIRGLLVGRKLNVDGCNRITPEGDSIIADEELAIYASRFSVGMAFEQPRSSDPAPIAAGSVGVTQNLIVEADS